MPVAADARACTPSACRPSCRDFRPCPPTCSRQTTSRFRSRPHETAAELAHPVMPLMLGHTATRGVVLAGLGSAVHHDVWTRPREAW
jgi:hypothetical protein